MKRPKAKKTGTLPLAETEWDFGPVPDEEIEPCCFYEYAREYFNHSKTLQILRSVWQVFEQWWEKNKNREIPREMENGLLAMERASRVIDSRGVRIPFDFRTFPRLGWQELRELPRRWVVEAGTREANERERKLKLRSDRFHIETLAQLEPPNIRSLAGWIHYHQWFHREDLANSEYGFFSINWDYAPSEIRQAFEHWLEDRLKERKSKPRFVTKSRGKYRDKLRCLGALRVKRHYAYRDLVDYNDTNLKVSAPYSHYPDLIKNANKAERLIGEMFPSEAEASRIVAGPLEDS